MRSRQSSSASNATKHQGVLQYFGRARLHLVRPGMKAGRCPQGRCPIPGAPGANLRCQVNVRRPGMGVDHGRSQVVQCALQPGRKLTEQESHRASSRDIDVFQIRQTHHGAGTNQQLSVISANSSEPTTSYS